MWLKSLPVLLLLVIVFTTLSWCENFNNAVLDNFNWECANNASCVRSVAKNLLRSYQKREAIDFGLFSIEPVENRPRYSIGRSTKIWDFFNGNAVHVPIGPMILSVQRSDDPDYVEVALLKKVLNQGRQRQGAGGGGGGKKKQKKQLQVFIPLFLAANTIGWMFLAVKAVGVLTLKAFLVSKLALIVAASVIVKKLMDNATEKMFMSHYPEHHHHPSTGYAVPYNMEYALPAAMSGNEIGASEVYSIQMAHPHTAIEHIVPAESSLSHHAVELQNATNPHPHLMAAVGGVTPKIKRDDSTPQWPPNVYYPFRKMRS